MLKLSEHYILKLNNKIKFKIKNKHHLHVVITLNVKLNHDALLVTIKIVPFKRNS